MKTDPSLLSPDRDSDGLLATLHELDDQDPGLRVSLLRLLDHEDPDIRAEVVRILVRRWKDVGARPTAFRLLSGDRDEEVREAAAFAIAGSTSSSSKEGDTRALLSVLRDLQETVSVRGAAYDGLLIIHRRPLFPTKRRDFDPESDVDWDWVSTLEGLAGSRTPSDQVDY